MWNLQRLRLALGGAAKGIECELSAFDDVQWIMGVKVRELTAVEYYSQVTAKEVRQLLGIKSKSTFWLWVREGKIPAPRYIAPHQPRWRLGEIVDLLEKQPGPKDAPRGLKGHVPDEFVPEPKGKGGKESNVWARLGLRRPS